MTRIVRMGRFTAALGLIALGTLLLLNGRTQIPVREWIRLYWPLLPVSLGIEVIVTPLILRKSEAVSRLDLGVLFRAALLAAIVIFFTQKNMMNIPGFQDLFGTADYAKETGSPFHQSVQTVRLDGQTSVIAVADVNGNVHIRQDAVSEIQIRTDVYVDEASPEQAAEIAAQSTVEIHQGSRLELTAQGMRYGQNNRRIPRMNMTITLPAGLLPAVEVKTDNGGIDLRGITVSKTVTADSIKGDITANSLSAAATDLKTLNGKITINGLQGDAKAETVNGNVQATGLSSAVRVNTVQGDIDLRSDKVGGDWDVSSALGKIFVTIPQATDAKIDGSVLWGSINTDFPFTARKRRLTGTLGTGEYLIHMHTNAGLSINKTSP